MLFRIPELCHVLPSLLEVGTCAAGGSIKTVAEITNFGRCGGVVVATIPELLKGKITDVKINAFPTVFVVVAGFSKT